MYCQLGTTRFDGAKSFVTFNSDEEAIIVEHAIIGRRARLQGAGLGLRNISLSLFLHQEFCQVLHEVRILRQSKNSFEILPLLWGNGHIEGEFVIMTMSETKIQQDAIGNTVSTTVNLTLKESVEEDKLDKKQAEAQASAFAVGSKKPATKSNRVNQKNCEQTVSSLCSGVKANGSVLNKYCQGYTNIGDTNWRIKFVLNRIDEDAKKLADMSATSSSCAYGIPLLNDHAKNVRSCVATLLQDVVINETTYANLLYTPITLKLKDDNQKLQRAIQTLDTTLVASPLIKGAITIK
ncbi:phage tail protein [Chitinophaga sp. CF418]|uniref:phage tail protein n=1 Tax=Chitinophaga sp. CF418 TaxID=1855287 RepID=UPI00091EEC73|nr:phage tail protein [Chitinophaga sp. CF418]SHN45942.1 Phage protein U [Chitinophaga sp. CF418]